MEGRLEHLNISSSSSAMPIESERRRFPPPCKRVLHTRKTRKPPHFISLTRLKGFGYKRARSLQG